MLKPSTPIIWYLAGATAVVAAGYSFVVRPIDRKRADVQQDNARKQATTTTLVHSMTGVADRSTKAAALAKAVADFEARLPADGQMDKVLEDIWRMAQANSLQTKTVRTPFAQSAAGYGQQTMELSLAGDFAGFYQFLLQLEDGKHLMRIRKMHLNRSGDGDSEVQADISLIVYFQPGPATP